MTLATPARPAAASVCPMLVFTEPTSSGRSARPFRRDHRPKRADLDRIAKRRAGAVRLDIAHLVGRHAGIFDCGADHGLLCGPVGRGDPAAAPVLIERRAADDGQHAIAVRLGVIEPLEHEHDTALAAHITIGRGIECLAAAIGRHHPALGEADVQFGRKNEVHPAGQRGVALAEPQRLDGKVQCHQRRRAGSIHRHGRAQ